MKKLKILVVFDISQQPPADQDYTELFEDEDWYTEAAVVETLREMGHEVLTLGIFDDIRLLINAVLENHPDVVFNLTEVFMNKAHLDKNIPALLDLLNVPYTGCGPDSLVLCNNKAISKKIMTYHRIRVPEFCTCKKGKSVRIPKKMSFPMIVKPLREEASTGISQSSYAANDSQLRERIKFVHDNMNRDTIVEEYIQGRELYVSVLGNKRLWAFPIREMFFGKTPDEDPKIATYAAKWDEQYRKRWEISNGFARDIPDDLTAKIHKTCKRAYRALGIDGHARFDCRLTTDGKVYILEANGNPELAMGDEFAESADKGGFPYPKLLSKMISMAFDRE